MKLQYPIGTKVKIIKENLNKINKRFFINSGQLFDTDVDIICKIVNYSWAQDTYQVEVLGYEDKAWLYAHKFKLLEPKGHPLTTMFKN